MVAAQWRVEKVKMELVRLRLLELSKIRLEGLGSAVAEVAVSDIA